MLLAKDLDFTGRRVLITGAAGGLGSALTSVFASHRASLILADSNVDRLRELASSTGIEAEIYAYDQGDPDSVEGLVDTVGTVDVLINNAGILLFKSLLDSSVREIQRIFEVNVIGVMLLAQGMGRRMIAQRRGVIVNVGSQLSFCGGEFRGVYASSKAAVAQFTRAAAVEWGPQGVRVVCMAPGRTATPLNEEVRRDARDRGIARIPLRRYGTPEEAAKLALFLASEAASYITGETVIADGGFVIG